MPDHTPYVRRVFYYETDQMGIVHHANYIRWLEEARIETLRKNGIDYRGMEANGILIPVVSVACSYLTAALYDETIEVRPRVTAFNGIRLKLEYEICSADRNILLSTGKSEHCFLDSRTRRPLVLQKTHPEYYAAFQALVEPGSEQKKKRK